MNLPKPSFAEAWQILASCIFTNVFPRRRRTDTHHPFFLYLTAELKH
jgi:hypothetical protein